MIEIELTNGGIALIDVEDFSLISKYKWLKKKAGKSQYAYSTTCTPTRCMHRLIMKADGPLQVDHINGNGLDNRKSNLRMCTIRQNVAHRLNRSKNTVGYIGVYLVKRKYNVTKKYFAASSGKHLGYFECPTEAAKARDLHAKKLYGEFAVLNFP